ncbi:MAG: Amidohydrolase 3 [Parcubacteria group bacterium GW2011_GWB1_43_8]|nr:MAG: Amidohydrolase 3 [Parcubacteria group bacterium GW2011_GWB1_43_8]
MSHYSTIIKNGLVFDGKGNRPVKTDIGISDDEITKIGDLQTEAAYNIVDATGRCVAPGFIDITNHSDTHWTIFSFLRQESLVSQGITTIIGGNCGSSLAPFLGEASAKEIGRWADTSKININWQTVEEFLAEMDRHKLGLNFGTLVGLNTIRRSIVSDKQKIGKIKILLKSNDLGFFSDEEMADIFKILQPYDAVVKHHLEDEGSNILPAVSRLIGAARSSKTKMHISHFKSLGRSSWNYFSQALEMVERARKEGVKITYDFFPYTKTGSSLFAALPPWFRKYSSEEARLILSSPDDNRRRDLKDYLKKMTLHYDKIIIASATSGLGMPGKTIGQIAAESGRDGEETVLNLLEANDLRVSIFNEVISEFNLELIAKDRFSVVSSDGVGYDFAAKKTNDLPHPRSFGTFPRAISQLAKKKGIMPLETMISKMTGLPAHILGIKDRGMIEKGKKADLVVFDLETIEDIASYENPFAPSSGIQYVFVNGQAVVSSGKITGSLPGKAIRNR